MIRSPTSNRVVVTGFGTLHNPKGYLKPQLRKQCYGPSSLECGRVYHDKDPSEEAEQANVVFLNEGARPFGGASQMDGWVRQERTT